MHKFILITLVFTGWMGNFFGNEEIHSFVENLPKEQRLTLDWFFRNCLKSFGGYVLCGNKPMCIESFVIGPKDLNLSEWSYAKMKAFQILKEWSTDNRDKEYLFLFCNYYQHSHMIIINRQEFLKTVNNNLSLFQYILGRTITAEKLLTQLIENQDKFWDIIKENTLVGILLGYGTNNSLIYSRIVDICENNSIQSEDEFPFYCCIKSDNPSLEFESLEEEKATLQNMNVGSYSMTDCNTYAIPCFGCVPDSGETASLLSTYEKNRENIISLAEGDNFLEKILGKIFTTTSGKIKIPNCPMKSASDFDLQDEQKLSSQFAEIFQDETGIKGLNQRMLLKSLLQGMIRRENGEESVADTERGLLLVELSTISQKLECCRNLIRANKCFKRISSSKNWISLVPNGIAYKVLKKGKGAVATPRIKSVTFHLSSCAGEEKEFTRFDTIKNRSVEHLVSGIARALIGMRKGEQRMLCIHPRYAYGFPIHPNKAPFFAEIQLMDFVEGDTEARIQPPLPLEPTYSYIASNQEKEEPLSAYGLDSATDEEVSAIYEELSKKYRDLYARKFRNYGYDFCSLIKKYKIPFDLKIFHKQILATKKVRELNFETAEHKLQFIFDFKIFLFCSQYEKGICPPFPQSWL